MARRSTSRNRTLSNSTLKHAARTLRVLAHPHRLRIVEILINEPVPVGDLAEMVGLGQASVSQHLSQLRAHGIVEAHREGRLVYYEVILPHASDLLDCIRKYA